MLVFRDQTEERKARKALEESERKLSTLVGNLPGIAYRCINKVLKDPLDSLTADRHFEIKESITSELWPVPHDPHQIGAVFRNVITNAVEAMPDGGTLTIKAENLGVGDVHQDPALPLNPGDYVHIFIRDEGKGIPEENLDKIFDPYFSTKRMGVAKGMGLGLATSHAIVQKHGGHISIESKHGAGTTVDIYFPAKGQTMEVDDTIPAETDFASPTIRVLVMDDEELLRKLARQMLERMGHAVETVKDGLEAIRMYKKGKDSGNPFNAAILDLTIKGGMGGKETIRELLKIDPRIRAIVSSGYSNDPVMADFNTYGFVGALAKPYEKKDLERVLRELSA